MVDRLRPRLVFATYRLLGFVVSRLPESVAYGVGFLGGLLMYYVSGSRAMVERHVRRVLGDELDGSQGGSLAKSAYVRRWVRRSFTSYARYWIEGARLPTCAPSKIRQHMMIEPGFDALRSAASSGKGVVLALPHVGSWEWGAAFLSLEDMAMTAVAERIEPPALFDYFVAQRRSLGVSVVPLDSRAGASVLGVLRDGGIVGLMCDRDLTGDGVEVEFFGELTTLPAGPAALALRAGASLMVACVYSGPGRDHSAFVAEPIDTSRKGTFREDVKRLTQEIAGNLESCIRVAPQQWHLFQPNWPSDRTWLSATRDTKGDLTR